MAGPKANRSITSRKGGSPLHFMRVLKYSRPYMRYLCPALACVVMVALTYGANIFVILPTIHFIADKQGVPAWVDQYIIGDRCGLVFGDAVVGLPARVARIEEAELAPPVFRAEPSFNRFTSTRL